MVHYLGGNHMKPQKVASPADPAHLETDLNETNTNRNSQDVEEIYTPGFLKNHTFEGNRNQTNQLQQTFFENRYPSMSFVPTYRQQLENYPPSDLRMFLQNVLPAVPPVPSALAPATPPSSPAKNAPQSIADIILAMNFKTKWPQYESLFQVPDFPEDTSNLAANEFMFTVFFQNLNTFHCLFNTIQLIEKLTVDNPEASREKSFLDFLKPKFSELVEECQSAQYEYQTLIQCIENPYFKDLYEFSNVTCANITADSYLFDLKQAQNEFPIKLNLRTVASYLMNPQDFLDLYTIYKNHSPEEQRKIVKALTNETKDNSSTVNNFINAVKDTRQKYPLNQALEQLYQFYVKVFIDVQSAHTSIYQIMEQRAKEAKKQNDVDAKKTYKEEFMQTLPALKEKCTEIRKETTPETRLRVKHQNSKVLSACASAHLHAEGTVNKTRAGLDLTSWLTLEAEKRKLFADYYKKIKDNTLPEKTEVFNAIKIFVPLSFHSFDKLLSSLYGCQQWIDHTRYKQHKLEEAENPASQKGLGKLPSWKILASKDGEIGKKGKVSPEVIAERTVIPAAELIRQQENRYLHLFQKIYEAKKMELIISNFEKIHEGVIYTDDPNLKSKLKSIGNDKYLPICRKANNKAKTNSQQYDGNPVCHISLQRIGTVVTVLLPNERQAILGFAHHITKDTYLFDAFMPGVHFKSPNPKEPNLFDLKSLGTLSPAAPFMTISEAQSLQLFDESKAMANEKWKTKTDTCPIHLQNAALLEAVGAPLEKTPPTLLKTPISNIPCKK